MSLLFGSCIFSWGSICTAITLWSSLLGSATHLSHNWTKHWVQTLLFEPIRVVRWPRALTVKLKRWPVHVHFHQIYSTWLKNLLVYQCLEVAILCDFKIGDFISEHVNFFLLEIRKLSLQELHLFSLNFMSNTLPFSFKLETIFVIGDTPFAGCRDFLRSRRWWVFCLRCWSRFNLNFFDYRSWCLLLSLFCWEVKCLGSCKLIYSDSISESLRKTLVRMKHSIRQEHFFIKTNKLLWLLL